MTPQRIAYLAWLALPAALAALACYVPGTVPGEENSRVPTWTLVTKNSIHKDMPADVRALVEKTFSSDHKKRRVAARDLGQLDDRAVGAIPFLIRLLDDKEGAEFGQDPGWEAEMALVRLGARAVQPLIAALGAPGNPNKKQLGGVLGLIGDRRAVPALVSALDDHDADVRWDAAWALENIPDPRAVEPLLRHLGGDNPEVAHNVIRALAASRDRRAVEPLIAIVRNRALSSGTRDDAAWALGQFGDRRAFEPLLALFRNGGENRELRNTCLGSLGGTKDLRAFDVLREALRSEDEFVRVRAIGGLAKLGDSRCVALLRSLLNDRAQSAEVHEKVAFGMVETGDSEAIDHAYEDSLLRFGEAMDLRLGLIDRLAMSSEKEAHRQLVLALRYHESSARFEAVRVLAESTLTSEVGTDCVDIRRAVQKLPALDDPDVLEALIRIARDKSQGATIRTLACQALRRSADAKALEVVKELGDPAKDAPPVRLPPPGMPFP